MRLGLPAVAALVLLVSAENAQPADEAFSRLAAARSLRCDFRTGTQASWDGGKLKMEAATFGEGGRVTFDSIDAKAGKARIIGNAGAGDIGVMLTPSGLTFVEQTGFGKPPIATFGVEGERDRLWFEAFAFLSMAPDAGQRSRSI